MEEVICKNCGRPLVRIANITDEECKELIYLNSVQSTVDSCLENFNMIELDKKLKNCIRRLFAKKAEEFIARKDFFNKISKKYNVTDFEIIDGVLYVHKE